ncbi:glutamate-5-semialdehyde dehydrogenase [Candidatus Pelagibacter communis]|uniref:glutamate-5-semialdehyde dehydrogenase n=1 Tax=Pelagibacter ubique TaxID=198252 RepID=UPI00094C045B|nr:glutamate-5-semialdehyde dehydrogenase [Candidatus Pelagibacter ubique]
MKNYLYALGKKAKKASIKSVSLRKKNKVLKDYCNFLIKNKKRIISENAKDLKIAKEKKLKENLLQRLLINEKRIFEIINSIKKIIKFKDPVNQCLKKWKRPSGLKIEKITTPIGVIGVIYESRPNVTSDIASLCFKSNNPVILKGGSEAYYSNKIFTDLFRKSLIKNKVDINYVQLINYKNRKVVDFLLTKMIRYIDVIIPRGGKSLVKKVKDLSKVPIIGHLEGICHTYIDKDANLSMAKKITLNAKLRNTAICGATETILIHQNLLNKFCIPILSNLEENGCKIIGDNKIKRFYRKKIQTAKKSDWSKEYLSSTVSIKSVKNIEEAIDHINKYGTMHTDSIITKNSKSAKKFLKEIKSSIAMHNTSTQFADGGEFGFGGEVGISTNTLPPRGPVGLNQLVSYKYQVSSNGKTRK